MAGFNRREFFKRMGILSLSFFALHYKYRWDSKAFADVIIPKGPIPSRPLGNTGVSEFFWFGRRGGVTDIRKDERSGSCDS